ncbi:hypothetical protein QA601_10440 [Chitinispirillales bacterium ANBcel5]|uniref:hypothetical protein n=1 Tax=Cellulosispirillum alkaliphilum TaxID=3039283 RepID=UPI002A58B3B2|nr:hypothetical protein [Chitinispirillales bacterium ANBcel5]
MKKELKEKTAPIWSAQEMALIDLLSQKLANAGMKDEEQWMSNNLSALHHQARALELYPSILQCNRIGSAQRNAETLVSELCSKYKVEDTFVMPTKAHVGRSFEIGRINLLYMVHHLLEGMEETGELQNEAFGFITDHMLTIMSEDVLLELLSDTRCEEVKGLAAKVLARIWEERISLKTIPFISELRNMWLIRRQYIPVFGTLTGVHEYISLLGHVNETCQKYIHHASHVADEAAALEEFLFGLSYEELCTVKKELFKSDKASVKRDEVLKIIGKDTVYLSSRIDDPVELYRFFNHRKKSAFLRWYSQKEGPVRTFEENFMLYTLLNADGADFEPQRNDEEVRSV